MVLWPSGPLAQFGEFRDVDMDKDLVMDTRSRNKVVANKLAVHVGVNVHCLSETCTLSVACSSRTCCANIATVAIK